MTSTLLETVSTSMALPELATAINTAHREAIKAARSAIEHARDCGGLLLQAKQAIPHGGFLSWLKDNCEVGERQARRYMKVAENWDAIESKTDLKSDLTITAALQLLSAEQWLPLPDGFRYRTVENDHRQHIHVCAPSGRTMELSNTGAKFPEGMTKTEWLAFGYFISALSRMQMERHGQVL